MNTPALQSIIGALREYADLQDMVQTSGGTFPVRLNGAYPSESLRHYADMLAAQSADYVGWIPVSERLPPKMTDSGDWNYVQMFRHGAWTSGYCDGTHWWDDTDRDVDGCSQSVTIAKSGVTHWQPLPEAPKETK